MSGHCFLTTIKWCRDHESTPVFYRTQLASLGTIACTPILLALGLGTTQLLDTAQLRPWHTQGHTEFYIDCGRRSLCSSVSEAVSGHQNRNSQTSRCPSWWPSLVLSHNRTQVMSSKQGQAERHIWVADTISLFPFAVEEASIPGWPVVPGSSPRRILPWKSPHTSYR